MTRPYTTDNECLLRAGIWALVGALVLSAFSLLFIRFWPSAVIVFVVFFLIGFGVAVFVCKSRTVGRGAVDLRAVDLARAEMGLAEAASGEAVEKAAGEQAIEAAPEAAIEAEDVQADTPAPTLLRKARDGRADDLKKIKGVGPKLEKELNAAGVFHFDQIANWTAEEVLWADQELVSLKGRVTRDNWVDQAKDLIKT